MDRHLDTELRGTKQLLVTMAGLVEKAIENTQLALQACDLSKIEAVYAIEKKVNESHILVDDACLKLLALQQPLAADLRLILAIIKINTDLERMGDQAVNIANNSKRYLSNAPIKSLIDLPVMFSDVRIMVREALDAFVRADQVLAKAVLKRDDNVDALKDKIFRDVLEVMKKDASVVEQGLNLILIARNLERIGDHATNIAEDVIFAISGQDIRHAGKPGA